MKLKLILIFSFFLSLPAYTLWGQDVPHQFSLKECINYGLQNHPSIRMASNNHARGEQEIRESLGTYLPQVNFQMNLDDNIKLQQTIIPAGMLGPGSEEQRIAFGTQYNSTMSVQLDQKLFDYSRIVSFQAIRDQRASLQLQEEQSREDVIYNVAATYFQILVAEKQMSLLLDNKSRLDKILSVTTLQADQGVAKKVDVKQVQVNLNNVISQISTLKNSLKIARNSLKNNMGLSLSDSLTLADTARWLNQQPHLLVYPAFDFARTRIGQLQSLQISLLDYQRKSAKATVLPIISLYARYGANGFGNDFGGAFSPLLDYSAIGLQFTWNLFSGFSRDARIKQATLDLSNAQINMGLNSSLMELQYENATAKSKEAQTMILTNQDNMNLASEVYDNTTLQYRQGVASLSDLLNAELSYKEAQNNYIHSLLDYYLADLDVQKANGTLEQYYNEL